MKAFGHTHYSITFAEDYDTGNRKGSKKKIEKKEGEERVEDETVTKIRFLSKAPGTSNKKGKIKEG